jgi:hypothetical protein
MKNYLVGVVRPVRNFWGPWRGIGINPQHMSELKLYQEMYQLSRRTARHFLKSDWQEYCITSPVLDARLNAIHCWYQIKELWHQERCNILCMGADTLFIKPTDIFNRFEEMRLFNFTDPRSHIEVTNYFNDDIKYFPATMSPNVWEYGERMMARWFNPTDPDHDWAVGQIIHNHMFWNQGLSLEQAHLPELAFQILNYDEAVDSEWNRAEFNLAQILHLHSSRNTLHTLHVMQSIVMQLGI